VHVEKTTHSVKLHPRPTMVFCRRPRDGSLSSPSLSPLHPYLQQILPILTMSNATNRCRIFSLLLKNSTPKYAFSCVSFFFVRFSREKHKKWRYLHEEVSLGVIENRFSCLRRTMQLLHVQKYDRNMIILRFFM
jgi:hypothetical protein